MSGSSDAAHASGRTSRRRLSSGKKKLSIQARAQWRKILDYARREATSKLQMKNKRFLGLRKFAEQAAKRKAEAAEKKRKEKVLARKLKKEGKGGETVATTSSIPNDASPSNKRKGLFGRIRAEKKEKKRAAKV